MKTKSCFTSFNFQVLETGVLKKIPEHPVRAPYV